MRLRRRSAGRPAWSSRTRRASATWASPTLPLCLLPWVSTWRLLASSSRILRRMGPWRMFASSSTSQTTPPSSASSPPASPSPPPSTSLTSATSTSSSSSPTCRRMPMPSVRCLLLGRRSPAAAATLDTCTRISPPSTSALGVLRVAMGPSLRSLCLRCPTMTSRTPSLTLLGTLLRGRSTLTASFTTGRSTPPSTCSPRCLAL
mmetsp:Transcript_11158/g.26093  ORF Transcript_11158/g.26093 Transcript_11158/m.26093 type:complete len:204 (+) Transcript_11158:579-1190(+)